MMEMTMGQINRDASQLLYALGISTSDPRGVSVRAALLNAYTKGAKDARTEMHEAMLIVDRHVQGLGRDLAEQVSP